MTKKIDPDVLALKRARKALDGCSSIRAVRATLDYLYDFYIGHPSEQAPEHLRHPKFKIQRKEVTRHKSYPPF